MSIRTPSSARLAAYRHVFVAFALGLSVVSGQTSARAGGDDDPLADYRERFKTGLDKYKAGAVAEAIQYWEPIYRELGASKGYRLAFNLARAYETFGDFTRAGERYESFLGEVSSRRAKQEKLDSIVEKEEREARARLGDLQANKARIKVNAGERPVAVRIDAGEPRVSGFVAYVPPGDHVVILGVGSKTPERRELTVKAGEVYELTPQAPEAPPPEVVTRVVTVPSGPPLHMEKRTEHPFSPAVLYVAGGITLASVVVPLITYQNAKDFQKTHVLSGDQDPASQQNNASIRSDYKSQSTAYYVTLAVPITLGAATLGLTAWYFLATKTREVPVITPTGGVTKDGATLGVRGRF